MVGNSTQKNLRKENKRRELLNSAKNLFSSNGYHATRVKAISTEIGIGEGTLYYYFTGGKKEILSSLIKEESQIITENLLQTLNEIDQFDSLEKTLTNVAKEILKSIINNREIFVIYLRESHLLNDEINEVVIHSFNKVIEAITAILKLETKKVYVKELDIDLMVNQFLSSFSMIFLQKVILNKQFESHVIDEQLMTIVRYTMSTWMK